MSLNSTFASGSTRGFRGSSLPVRAIPIATIGNSGFPADGFAPGDTVELRYTGSPSTFTIPAGTAATRMDVHVIGAGGATQSDCGGWCSDTGGGGGGGAKAYVSGIGPGNSWNFFVAQGQQNRTGGYCGDDGYGNTFLPYADNTWWNTSGGLVGYGGQGGAWCRSDTTTASGGSFAINWGNSVGGSSGGIGGYAHNGGGSFQPTPGGNSTWGGGGGGGSCDTSAASNTLSNRLGGTGALGGLGGTGEYFNEQLRTVAAPTGCVPTAHRGGGAGGVASNGYPGAQVYGVSGANGVILITFS